MQYTYCGFKLNEKQYDKIFNNKQNLSAEKKLEIIMESCIPMLYFTPNTATVNYVDGNSKSKLSEAGNKIKNYFADKETQEQQEAIFALEAIIWEGSGFGEFAPESYKKLFTNNLQLADFQNAVVDLGKKYRRYYKLDIDCVDSEKILTFSTRQVKK